MGQAAQTARDLALPALRDDLRLLPGPDAADGTPSWNIYDPVRHRYFRVGWPAFEMLSRWSLGRASAVVTTIRAQTTCEVDGQDVEDLVKFLLANQLTREAPGGDTEAYAAQARALRPGWRRWLVHQYLFFRIPVVRPDAFLRRTLRWVEPCFAPATGWALLILGAVALHLVGRQWDAFLSTFLHFFTWQGLLVYAAAQIFVKVLHELGHAYTAVRQGCRVPVMGVAFLVLFPVLYTDVTDAWRLRSRRARLAVGAAGMLTELGVAAIATFAWTFLPDGPLRSVAFVVGTTSWGLTLLVNLNPFLRFDGYYLLSDWWGVPNLQQRSFALGRWKLREILFDLGDETPVDVSPRERVRLVAFAWCTWIYRFFLFVGIALLVYHLFPKALAIVFFVVEIAFFIGFPVLGELRVWWERRDEARRTLRFALVAGGGVALLLALVLPWRTSVALPAVLEAERSASVFAPEPARIATMRVTEGQHVAAGDVLVTLEAPGLVHRARVSARRIAALRIRARRAVASDEARAALRVFLEQLAEEESMRTGLEERLAALTLRAPVDGVVTHVAYALHPGRWVNPQLALVHVADPSRLELRALAPEREIGRLREGQQARFVPEAPERASLRATVREIGLADLPSFDSPYLASIYGGAIAVRPDSVEGDLEPESSVYRVRLAPHSQPEWPGQVVRGSVHVQGTAESLARRLFDAVLAVLIRETGL